MIRRALVVLVLAVPALAHAGRHCREVSSVVGKQRCSRFGTWTAPRGGPAWELGAASFRIDSRAIDASASSTGANGAASTSHVVAAPGDDRPAVALGAEVRASVQFTRVFYLVGQANLGAVRSGPQLIVDTAARGIEPMGSVDGGVVAQVADGFGLRTELGPATLGAELAGGIRIASYALSGGAAPAGQAWGLVDARAKADLWLAPNWTLGVHVESDLVNRGVYVAGVTLGVHLFPYDGQR